MINLSTRIRELAPSATLAMKARAKTLSDQGIQVISLGAGEPDFETPACIIEAAHAALKRGVNRYTPCRGTDELIAGIQAKFQRDQGISYASGQVMATVGAKSALALALDSLLEPGDEAIVLKPYWVSYPELVKLAGAKAIFVVYVLKQLEEAINPKTRVLILNSPNNPAGFVLGKDFLESLAKIMEDRNIVLISDEIYEHLVFDGLKHISIASLSENMREKTLVITGISKGYAMTGWRVGIAAGPAPLIQAMAKLQEQNTTCVAGICQAAAAYALSEPECVRVEIERMPSPY